MILQGDILGSWDVGGRNFKELLDEAVSDAQLFMEGIDEPYDVCVYGAAPHKDSDGKVMVTDGVVEMWKGTAIVTWSSLPQSSNADVTQLSGTIAAIGLIIGASIAFTLAVPVITAAISLALLVLQIAAYVSLGLAGLAGTTYATAKLIDEVKSRKALAEYKREALAIEQGRQPEKIYVKEAKVIRA